MLWPGRKTVKLIPLAFFAAINVAVTVSCEGAARDGALGAGKQSLLDSRNCHRFKNNIPPRNVTATVKLSGSATKRNAATATKLKIEFGCIKHINPPANCSTLKFVARPYELPIPLNFNLADQQAAQRHEHRDPRVGAAVLRRRAPRLQPYPSRQI